MKSVVLYTESTKKFVKKDLSDFRAILFIITFSFFLLLLIGTVNKSVCHVCASLLCLLHMVILFFEIFSFQNLTIYEDGISPPRKPKIPIKYILFRKEFTIPFRDIKSIYVNLRPFFRDITIYLKDDSQCGRKILTNWKNEIINLDKVLEILQEKSVNVEMDGQSDGNDAKIPCSVHKNIYYAILLKQEIARALLVIPIACLMVVAASIYRGITNYYLIGLSCVFITLLKIIKTRRLLNQSPKKVTFHENKLLIEFLNHEEEFFYKDIEGIIASIPFGIVSNGKRIDLRNVDPKICEMIHSKYVEFRPNPVMPSGIVSHEIRRH